MEGWRRSGGGREEIVAELRQVEALTGYGRSFAKVVKTFVITDKTHFRRRVEHDGLRTERVKRFEELELERPSSEVPFPTSRRISYAGRGRWEIAEAPSHRHACEHALCCSIYLPA